MSITDELREYVQIAFDKGSAGRARVETIADRIDAEHEADVSTACRLAAGLDNDALSKRGYIALPVDADGVPIHVGNRLTDGEYTFTAYELAVYGDGSWSIRNEDGIAWAACDLTHCAQTVEDVLREFAEKITDSQIPNVHPTYEEAIAEYAAKLRLAEEVDA